MNDCYQCDPGWTLRSINNSSKCLFISPSLPIQEAQIYCRILESHLPYPVTQQQKQNYRLLFNSIGIEKSVAVSSSQGLVEMKSNGDCEPFITKVLIKTVCEKKPKRLNCSRKSRSLSNFWWLTTTATTATMSSTIASSG